MNQMPQCPTLPDVTWPQAVVLVVALVVGLIFIVWFFRMLGV